METYNIDYEILDYDKFYQRLNNIYLNPNNENIVQRHEPIGYTKCGFPIEHYSIGSGPMHIVYMGGAHGNEIIGVDYVTQLMNNIALGKGEFASFNPEQFTIDFIPCQNPEGFFTTTYALKSAMKDLKPEEIESFCKQYFQLYREDDQNVININRLLRGFCEHFEIETVKDELVRLFWQKSTEKDITPNYISAFLITLFNIDKYSISTFIKDKWQELMPGKEIISKNKKHHEFFKDITINCIPEKDEAHKKLKMSLASLYATGAFPMGTLANFFSNASGVNLNDNNPYYFEELKNKMVVFGDVYANLRDNNLLKTIPGPVGTPSEDMYGEFKYAPENEALLSFLAEQDENNQNYAFVNCHGTGGILYIYPVAEDDTLKAHTVGTTRDFKFFINSQLGQAYTERTNEVYQEQTGKENQGYKTVGFPDRITGVGDYLRKKYIASFLLELSKMGGNPIAPYGDKEGNYFLTMTANMSAANNLMQRIKELAHLYDIDYTMNYDESGRVHYGIKNRR